MDDLEVHEILLKAAIEYSRLDEALVLATLNDPEWERYRDSRVHNWRRYIEDSLKKTWEHLSTQARLAAFIGAARSADSENWE